jgi:A/G-specific adenine glycosylase
LLAWYDANRRDLPWRRTRDPYAVWVSEIMLQQTRVETVVPYYERWMQLFPSARSLAAASEDEVLAAFSGVPSDPGARRALAGIGRYTAGAIGSIAFDREEAIVDGNVARVLSRVFSIEDRIGSPASERALWSHAEALVRGPRPGDLNQALMELGALVCVPKNPRCDRCPLAASCLARESGRQDELPAARARKAPTRVSLASVVVSRGDRVWLVRSKEALFRGLFGPPSAEGHGRDAAKRALRIAGASARVEAEPRATIEHVLTHRRLNVEVWRAKATRVHEDEERKLVALDALGTIGISKLARRILAAAV